VGEDSDRSRLLLEINNAITTTLDLRELILEISNCLRPIFQHDGAALAIYSPEKDELRAFALDPPQGIKFDPVGTLIPIEGTPPGLALRTKQPVIVTEPDKKKFHSPVVQRTFDMGINSGCAVPIMRGDRVLGVIAMISKKLANFTPEKVDLLREICGQFSIAVENAQNFENARRERDRTKLLLEVNNAIVSHLDLRDLLLSLSRGLKQIVPHDGAFLILRESDHHMARVQALDTTIVDPQMFQEGIVIPVQGTPEGKALESGLPVLVRTADLSTYPSPLVKAAMQRGIQSGCAVPLISHGKTLGAVTVVSMNQDAFNEDDAELLRQCSNQIAIAVENALSFQEIQALKNKLATEKLYLEDEIRTEHNFEELVGSTPNFKRVLKQIETVAPTDSCVLIRGETGTGKELIARAIHALSDRKDRALIKLNCSAIPTGLLESELFGHEKGAFTGAIEQRIGRFELAHKGTLFLDEVGDIPPELQPKLLRVLQEQEFERLGSTKTQKVDVRLIAATNADLEQLVAERKYRSDLYYRISGFPISIPPLRDRRQDIPELARFFAQKYARRLKKQIDTITSNAIDALMNYPWPGNIRELEHFIERAVIFTAGSTLEISTSELVSQTSQAPASTLEESERQHTLQALEVTNWIVGGPSGAAARLGLKRTTLQAKMQKLGIVRR